MMKVNIMVQWTKHNQNNRLMYPPSLPWLFEISEARYLVLPGLTWQAGRQLNIRVFLHQVI